jgi:hypothetical protein
MELDLKELKVETENAQEQYEMLRQESLDLRDEFKAIYPASVCPVFLGRNSDKSLTPLFWRYSSTVKGKKGLRPEVSDFWALISKMNNVPTNLVKQLCQLLPEGASAPLTLKSPLKGEQPHFQN